MKFAIKINNNKFNLKYNGTGHINKNIWKIKKLILFLQLYA